MNVSKPTVLALAVSTFMMQTYAQDAQEIPHVELEPIFVSISGVGRALECGAGSVTSISQDELTQIGANDLADVVKYQPLVSAPAALKGAGNAWDSTGTTGINIRGMDGNRVGLDVDGVELPDAGSKPDGTFMGNPMNNSYGIGRDYIDPQMFREVRIQAGSTDARTDGLAGRMSFLTKRPSDYLTKDKTTAAGYKIGYDGSNDAISHAVHMAMGNETASALAVYSRRDGKETKANTYMTLEPMDWQSDALLLRGEYRPSEEHKLGATVDYYKKKSTLWFDHWSANNLYPKGGIQNANIERTRYGLDWTYYPEEGRIFDELTTQAFYQTAKNGTTTFADYVSRGTTAKRQFDTSLDTDTYGLKLLANKHIQGDKFYHVLEYGLDGSRTDDKRPWTQHHTASTGVVTTTKNNRMPSMQTDKFAAHVSDKITTQVVGRQMTIAPQLRFVYQEHKPTDLSDYLPMTGLSQAQVARTVQSSTNHYLSPGLTLSYQVTPQMLTYAKYNRSARLPTSTEKVGAYDGSNQFVTYAILGNPDLKQETSDAFELGLKGEPIKGVELTLSGFYNKYQNYIDYRALTGAELPAGFMTAYQVKNVADVDIWGGELGLKLNMGKFNDKMNGIGVILGAGISDYKATDNKGADTFVNSVLPAKATLGLSYDSPDDRFGMGLTSTFVAGKRSDAGEQFYRTKGYHVMDVATHWKVSDNMRLNFAINNIFNQKYHDYTTVATLNNSDVAKIERAYQPERHVTASMEFKF